MALLNGDIWGVCRNIRQKLFKNMETLFEGTEKMILIGMLCSLFVMVAMAVDLVSGLIKAKQRGEIRTSYGLRRTVNKFIVYEGGVLIAIMIDVMIHFSHLLYLFRLDSIVGFPVITCIMGVFLCFIEYLSIREKASDKTKRLMTNGARLAMTVLDKEKLSEIVAEAIKNATVNTKD